MQALSLAVGLCLLLFDRISAISHVDAVGQSKYRSIRNSTEAPHDRAICAALIRSVHPMLRRRRDFPFSNQLTADFARLLSDPRLI